MSQDDIIKILEEKKEPLTSKELAEYCNIRVETIRRTLKKLLKHKEVIARKITKREIKKKGYADNNNLNSRFRVFFVDKSC
jgi:transcription initiation factor IIE alpha subunit